MFDEELNEMEIASASVVKLAVRDLAEALAETDQFTAFEAAAERLRNDRTAQAAMQAFQDKQESLKMMLMLNAANPEERAELERLRQVYLAEPSVAVFLQTQADLVEVCQVVAEVLSQATELNYSAVCGASCCG